MLRGAIHFCERRYEEAIGVLRRVLETEPAYYFARWFLGMSYVQLGDYAAAIATYEQAMPAWERTDQAFAWLEKAYQG